MAGWGWRARVCGCVGVGVGVGMGVRVRVPARACLHMVLHMVGCILAATGGGKS